MDTEQNDYQEVSTPRNIHQEIAYQEEQNEEALDAIERGAKRIHHHAKGLNEETALQNNMLDAIADNVDNATDAVRNQTGEAEGYNKAKKKQCCLQMIILLLIVVLVVILSIPGN